MAYFASYALTGLIAFFLFLIPGVEFLEEILGGLITDLDDFILSLPSIPIVNLSNLFYIVESGAEVAVFTAYPVSWTLAYRPDGVWEVALQIIPWLASGAIIGALFPDNPKDAVIIGAGMILSAGLNVILLSTLLPNVILPMIPMVGPVLIGVLNGMATGFTDLPMGVSSFLTIVEGGGIFTAMVLFMSTLKAKKETSMVSEGGSANGAVIMTSFLFFPYILCIPGFIIGLVKTVKDPTDRKANAALIIGAMEVVIFVMILFIFVPTP
jgi:hypothetical protein